MDTVLVVCLRLLRRTTRRVVAAMLLMPALTADLLFDWIRPHSVFAQRHGDFVLNTLMLLATAVWMLMFSCVPEASNWYWQNFGEATFGASAVDAQPILDLHVVLHHSTWSALMGLAQAIRIMTLAIVVIVGRMCAMVLHMPALGTLVVISLTTLTATL